MNFKYVIGTALVSTGLIALAACKEAPVNNASKSETVLSQPATTAIDINAKLDQWFDAKFMESVKRSPMALAQIGIKERTDEWDDFSRDGAIEDLEFSKSLLADLKANFNRADLSPERQLSYDLFVKQIEDSIEGDKWWGYGYAFNQMFGAQSRIPTFMKNQHRVDNIEDAKAYIARLNGSKEMMGTIVANAEESAAKGIMPPKFVYDHVIRDIGNIMSGFPFDNSDTPSVLMEDFRSKVDKLNLEPDVKDELLGQATNALRNSVAPSYANLLQVMESQKAKATDEDGAWKLPNGDAFYAYRLKRMTTTDMTADQIHDLGLAEVDRIHGEMRDIMKKVGYEGTLQEFFEHLKTDPKFVYEDSDAGREAYLAEATRMIDTMKEQLGDYFLVEPKADLEVRKVEAFREKSAGKAFYNRPALDGSRPGIYYANLYKISDMPKYQMEALAYHEGIPGHHMQFAVTQELDIPKFQRFGSSTAHSEGWGLYSEYLPKEMGFYQDPYSDFGRLAMELWRAARLVVDTGLHDKKWTRQEAIDYLLTNTPNPENDCIKAIERYIVMPGQATAYKIGMNKILDLREMSKKKLGDQFDIREYHDVVLGAGPVPLSVLEMRVNDWINSKN